jgi:Aerotolerance regulator N-terminal
VTFINTSLLIGLALAAVPVILHLVMKARPKRIEFPALQILKARQPSNSRRMQLRQLMLLMLRGILIAAIVFALVRPSLPAANYGLRWWEWSILLGTAGSAFGIYRFLNRRDRLSSDAPHVTRERRGRRRILCTLGGLLAVLLAVGTPWWVRVQAELSTPGNEVSENIPVAVVFVFDTSLSMNYRHENLNRLDVARQTATDHLSRLPTGSRAAILSLQADDEVVFQADLSGAQSRMDALTLTAVPQSINAALKSAITGQIENRRRVREETGMTDSDLFSREICLVTDMSQAAWNYPDEAGLADLLKEHDWLQLYIVDVAAPQPINVSLTNLRLSDETAVTGRDISLTTTVSITPAADPNVQLETFLLNEEGKEVRVRAPQSVKVDTAATDVETVVPISVTSAYVQGFVRLAGTDPLADDNVRWFTLGVRPRPRVLLISDSRNEAIYLQNALQPGGAAASGIAAYSCVTVTSSQAMQHNFSDFDVVCMINTRRPDDATWNALSAFARSGGGVLVCMGCSDLNAGSWNSQAAQSLLPATPIRVSQFVAEPVRITLSSETHPVCKAFAKSDYARTALTQILFDRCWAIDVEPDAHTLMQLLGPGDRPLLLERSLGSGRCILFTSAMDNLVGGGSEWNTLVVDWVFLMLADNLMKYLAGVSDQRHNYTAGNLIDIGLPPSQRFGQYTLRRPGFRQTRGDVNPDAGAIILDDATDPGHYRLRPFESASSFEFAFAVNMRDQESDLSRITSERLNEIAGEDRVQVVNSPEQLESVVRIGRLGVELYPVLVGLLVLLFCAEHTMANYIYDEQLSSTPGPSAVKQGAE